MLGKKLFACQSAVRDFDAILQTIGGRKEQERARYMNMYIVWIEIRQSTKCTVLKLTCWYILPMRVLFFWNLGFVGNLFWRQWALMQTRWKTVITTDCFTFTCYFSITFPGKGRLILSKKQKKNGWNLLTWFYMSQCKPKVYQYHVLINRLLTDTNPQGRKKCDAFCWQF